MALQNFVDNSLPTIKAAWLNAVDAFYTTLFASATTAGAARTALGSTATGDALFTAASAAAALSTVAGLGTGGGTLTGLVQGAKSANIASAATVDLSTATGNEVHITGATGPITAFGTVVAGTRFKLVFDSTPTITYNGTSMILNNGTSDIVIAAGDTADAVSEGAGNWRVDVTRKAGTAIATTGLSSKLVSATRDLSAANGTQAITGAGFTPTSVVVFANVASTSAISWGFADSAKNVGQLCDANPDGAGTYDSSGNLIRLRTGAATANTAALTSYDSDGCTLTWTKTNSPSGTANLYLLFFK